MISIHPHAIERLGERGATEAEAIEAVETGERFQAKYGRAGFRLNIDFSGTWQGKAYNTKQLEVFAVKEKRGWMIITVIVKYF